MRLPTQHSLDQPGSAWITLGMVSSVTSDTITSTKPRRFASWMTASVSRQLCIHKVQLVIFVGMPA
jgi:hypothetical protein